MMNFEKKNVWKKNCYLLMFLLINTFEVMHSQNEHPMLLFQTCPYFGNAPLLRGYINCKKLVDFFMCMWNKAPQIVD